MFSEFIIKEISKIAISVIKERVKTLKFKISTTELDLQQALGNHVRMIKNWSEEASFKDLERPKSINSIYINLDIFLFPRRNRISLDEKIKKIPFVKIFQREKNHLVILGQPGAGKTSSMKFLCQSIFFNGEFPANQFCSPLLVKLRELNKPIKQTYNSGIIIEYLFNELGLQIASEHFVEKNLESIPKLKEKLIIDLLNSNNFLLIIEGFDEISYKGHKKIILDEIASLATQVETTRIIITSRTADYNYTFENTTQFEICPLNFDQIKEFSEKWLGEGEASEKFLKSIYNSPFADTAIRPLTIAHLCAIYERIGKIPEKPKTVYKKIISLLLEEWDEQRNIQRISNYASFELDRKLDFLTNLAFHLTITTKSTSFEKRDLFNIFYKIYQDYDLKRSEAKNVVSELESHTGLFLQSGFETFEFAHKSLQEFLSAEYIVRLPNIPSDQKIVQLLPNEFAISVAISSNPSLYFIDLIKVIKSIKKIGIGFIQPFLNRLILEKPEFNKNKKVGISALILYSIYLNESENLQQLNIFIIDDLISEFEKFMLDILKRNTLKDLISNYSHIESFESTNGYKIMRFKLKEDSKESENLPSFLNCRNSFLQNQKIM